MRGVHQLIQTKIWNDSRLVRLKICYRQTFFKGTPVKDEKFRRESGISELLEAAKLSPKAKVIFRQAHWLLHRQRKVLSAHSTSSIPRNPWAREEACKVLEGLCDSSHFSYCTEARVSLLQTEPHTHILNVYLQCDGIWKWGYLRWWGLDQCLHK